MNHKNRHPKSYKGCCVMCACKDHDGGVRNKRTLTRAEVSHLEVRRGDLEDPQSAVFYDNVCDDGSCDWCQRMDFEYLLDKFLAGEAEVFPEPQPLRIPLARCARFVRRRPTREEVWAREVALAEIDLGPARSR